MKRNEIPGKSGLTGTLSYVTAISSSPNEGRRSDNLVFNKFSFINFCDDSSSIHCCCPFLAAMNSSRSNEGTPYVRTEHDYKRLIMIIKINLAGAKLGSALAWLRLSKSFFCFRI